MFKYPLSIFFIVQSLEEAPEPSWLQVKGGLSIVHVILYMAQNDFLHNMALACEFLVTIEVKRKQNVQRNCIKKLNFKCY